MINTESWKPSNVVGAILMFLGLVPFVLWILDYVDVVRPGEEPMHWWITVVSAAMLGFGAMLRLGQGASIFEALRSWFPKRGDNA